MKTVILTITVLFTAFIVGCSNQTLYENIQISNQNECYKLPQPEHDECLNNQNTSFHEYEKDRQEVLDE